MHLNQISWPAESDVDELVLAAAGGDGEMAEMFELAEGVGEEEVCVLCAVTLRVRMCHIPSPPSILLTQQFAYRRSRL